VDEASATGCERPRNIFSVKVDRLDFEGVEVWC
jgi:hypothetical protein